MEHEPDDDRHRLRSTRLPPMTPPAPPSSLDDHEARRQELRAALEDLKADLDGRVITPAPPVRAPAVPAPPVPAPAVPAPAVPAPPVPSPPAPASPLPRLRALRRRPTPPRPRRRLSGHGPPPPAPPR